MKTGYSIFPRRQPGFSSNLFLQEVSFIFSFRFLIFPFISLRYLTLLSFPFLSFPFLSFPVLSFPLISCHFFSFPYLTLFPFLSFHSLTLPFFSFISFHSIPFPGPSSLSFFLLFVLFPFSSGKKSSYSTLSISKKSSLGLKHNGIKCLKYLTGKLSREEF